MAKQNIIIRKREEESIENVYNYCEIIGTKWFNRCKLPLNRKLRKGDVFNVYRMEYEEDGQGNVSRWLCERKYGCEFDGQSVESSLLALDQYIDENDYMRRYLEPNTLQPWVYLKPLDIFLLDREQFTENEAGAVTREQACAMADQPKGIRRVWRYSAGCSTFAADYQRGSINLSQFYVKTM